MDYFTADPHFGHANIIKFLNRPFASVEEMDATILENINKQVGVDDRLFVIGDFCWHNRQKEYLNRLTCRNVVLIRGNHDFKGNYDLRKSHKIQGYEQFAGVYDHYELKVTVKGQPQFIVMYHYPTLEWNRWHHGSWHLFGHVHGKRCQDFENELAIDAGVDVHDFKPLSVNDVARIMSEKDWESPKVRWAKSNDLWVKDGEVENRAMTDR